MKESLPYKKKVQPPRTSAPTLEGRDLQILAQTRRFLAEHIPAVDEKTLERSSPKELLDAYDRMMNEEPTLDGFRHVLLKQLCDQPGTEEQCRNLEQMSRREVLTDGVLSVKFKKFLLEKLPYDLLTERAERVSKTRGHKVEAEDLAEELSVDDLLATHEARTFSTIVGFHASKQNIAGDYIEQSRTPSTIVMGGKQVELKAGYSHYNLNPQALYKGNLSAGGPNFLYLVEGVSGDHAATEAHEKASGSKQWKVSAGQLRIRAKIELTPGVIRELGLKFE